MKDKVSAAEIDPGPIKNNSQIADVSPEEDTPPPNNESYPGKRTKPTTTITDKLSRKWYVSL